MNKVRQQRGILRIALYLLRENGYPKPKKKQVLNLIDIRNLMRIPEDDRRKRNENDPDEIWQNDIAYKRKDLFDDGLIGSPEHGRWELTEAGLKEIEEKKSLWVDLEDSEERKKLLSVFDYFTEDTLDWMLKIAKGDSLSLRNESPSQTKCPRI